MFLLKLTPWILLLVHVCAGDLDSWTEFQMKHRKIYQSTEESERRLRIFDANLLKIQEHNLRYEQGLETYTMGVNQFTDLTEEEFAARFKPWPEPANLREGGDGLPDGEIPESIDWRDSGVVTPVKNQGNCGGCWAFSTTGTLEAQWALQTGNLVSLSEQQLIDCDPNNSGCDGGVVQWAYDYIKASGLSSSDDYPYLAAEGVTCKKTKHKVVTLTDYHSIQQYNETELKVAVGLYGPVSVAINANPLQSYENGVFNSACSDDLNHGVLAVGYGTDNATGLEYWIIKNSWGADWGEEGYFRMQLGKGLCGVARQACYPLGVIAGSASVSGSVLMALLVAVLGTKLSVVS